MKTLLALSLLVIAFNVHAQSTCQNISNDADRLLCYDLQRKSPETEQKPASEQAGINIFQPSDDQEDLFLEERWELDSDLGEFIIRPYKPVYFDPIFYSSAVNSLPQTPNPRSSVSEALNNDNLEARFQLSFKTKFGNNLLGTKVDLWMGYTQSSFWQIYNSEESRPFRETNHEPEFMLVLPTNYNFLGFKGRLFSLSLNHQSNGQDDPLSRSWNRVILTLGYDRPNWAVLFRPWWRIAETADDDDNPDIEDYVGRAELLIVHRRRNSHQIAIQFRHSMKVDEDAHGSVNLEWSYPCFNRLRCHAQIFHGYGVNLIDYNYKLTSVGLGVALVEWF